MRKRIIVLAVIMCMFVTFVPCVEAEEITYGFLVFDTETGTIIDCNESVTDELVIPNEINGVAVVNIATYAFANCTSLENIIIPTSVIKIGYGAFENCSSLKRITIPDSVTEIRNGVFIGCTMLESIDVDNNNAHYSSYDGILFDKAQSLLIQYPAGKQDISYSIPNSVTEVVDSAFYGCIALESITMSNNNRYLGSYAFYGCTSLKNITMPQSMDYIGGEIFFGCTALESITIPNGEIGITDDMFHGCTALKNITIPDSITYIGARAFSGCSALETVIIPNSVKKIGYGAFEHCTSIKGINIPENVTEIDYDSFRGCTALESISIPNSVTKIDGWAFFNCTSLNNITLPDNMTEIGDAAFLQCTALENIIIPNNVVIIGNWAFDGCISLKNIIISDSVSLIGNYPFASCTALEKIEVNEYNENYSSYNGVFFNKDKTLLIQYPIGKQDKAYSIPNGVTEINDSAFANCTNIEYVLIPSSVTTIDSYAFEGCENLTGICYSGTKEEWEKIDIKDSNECITDATIHYEAIGTNLPKISEMPLVNGNNLIINLNEVEFNSSLITVFNNNGKMISFEITPISSGDTTKSVTLPRNGENQAKLFIWDSLKGMRPLCEAKTMTIN